MRSFKSRELAKSFSMKAGVPREADRQTKHCLSSINCLFITVLLLSFVACKSSLVAQEIAVIDESKTTVSDTSIPTHEFDDSELALNLDGFNSVTSSSVASVYNNIEHVYPSLEDQYPTENTTTRQINIGIVSTIDDSHKAQQRVKQLINEINNESIDRNISFKIIRIKMENNPTRMSRLLCDLLISNRVHAVIVEAVNNMSVAAISFTCSNYLIPVVASGIRDGSFSNKNVYTSFVRITPPHTLQADVWMKLMDQLDFSSVIILTSTQSTALLTRFDDLIDRRQANDAHAPTIESIIEFESLEAPISRKSDMWDSLVNRLQDIKSFSSCRVFLLHATTINDLRLLIELINHMNMTDGGHVLIMSEPALIIAIEHSQPIPIGTISIRLKQFDASYYILDAIVSITKAIKSLDPTLLTIEPTSSCDIEPVDTWTTGIELYRAILMQKFQGLSGQIEFDDFGERSSASYEVVNFFGVPHGDIRLMQGGKNVYNTSEQSQSERHQGRNSHAADIIAVVGHIDQSCGKDEPKKLRTNTSISIDVGSIVWPGGLLNKPSGIHVRSHLFIATLQEPPFVWIHRQPCESFVKEKCINESGTSFASTRIGSSLDQLKATLNNINFAAYLKYVPFIGSSIVEWLESNADTNRQFNRKNSLNDSSLLASHIDSHDDRIRIRCYEQSSQYSDMRQEFCCEGYCMDLLAELAMRLNFTFELYVAGDNQYGSVTFNEPIIQSDTVNPNLNDENNYATLSHDQCCDQYGSEPFIDLYNYNTEPHSQHQHEAPGATKWNGLVGELVSRRADMVFAPLSVTPLRAEAIDFSNPFKFHHFSILLRRESMRATLTSFLQPFQNRLWMIVIVIATHIVAFTLYLLERYSAFGWFGIRKRYFMVDEQRSYRHSDRPLNLSTSIWFSWSILLNSSIGEELPKSPSGRLLGVFWSFFAMIVVASYTANLAAFLVLDARDSLISISGIDDPRIKSGDLGSATVRGSAIDTFLASQVEYINLHRRMEENIIDDIDQGISLLRNGTIDSLIWDSTRLEWEVSHDPTCSVGIAGEFFGSSGYGIGLQKHSYWTENGQKVDCH
ncbi:Glutamate [NMDA] receptor subunit 1 [Fragariocoptes setiger]|uniref:Glutamate [NMDA] receptor subunit 1 n=1 Tax=Fragariocoptes setiger TaxID=1670756 RepID=A0ABQ7S719_9ACAR|nr:Glutamate [NMDA] receptor subunit 1 [Fragariocoptes setiger]